ncbi:1-pyrroline-5-carboxylate dehydrogenase [Deferribacter desulfuricans SSM1]|uniref:L-glutamate gamma-semialdehyde dehydrogenase n=1 Tax=Deferribacter desulfuricans (strain DSM 14783 / JCM 11476 / NBRC 101012 / SSM1) TaxID=639282 RepID=D3PD64_DEFDS|nr:L-glutamate gamma-semialdehyde dehydrogenase [Deferribacter desulfuricans]BAI80537.1 1-pyrroline-5-carboxylate dehydrogenase [Deferribacter desulfuricans SSM1]
MFLVNNSIVKLPYPENEPVYSYAPGTKERELLRKAIDELRNQKIEIPLIIGGKEVKTGKLGKVVCPHDHNHVLAEYHMAGEKEVKMAIEASLEAWKEWQKFRWEERAAIFLKAAELLAGKYRYLLNAATMLSVSKNVFQAEIDSACELIDFWRFNTYYMQQIYSDQPPYSPKPTWNYVQHRPLEGFIFAVTPFNFTSIGGNLPTAPAIMGNVVVWKPASTSVYAPYFIMKLLKEAGLPDGVINFIPGPGSTVGNIVLRDPNLAGIHFTGSTEVFQNMWKVVGENIKNYKYYPRIVGETGGKDFVFAHNSANVKKLVTALVRGAYEYQGQKCSAASRAYIPKSIWNDVKEMMIEEMKTIKMGGPEDFTNFFNAVIDEAAFENIKSYIDYAKNSNEAEILAGGGCDKSVGYFIEPTLIQTTNPKFKLMEEEIFGPVLTVYVYDDEKYEETLELCNSTSPYGLTGAIFGEDRKAVSIALEKLEYAAGNFYVNDKPTGAVVGQQPFGGSRASGTNDKAGSYLNLIRWVTPRTIKENFDAPEDYRYSFMNEE